jgi:HSP20 family protein
VMHMSDSPADIFQQLNELMKRLMEQGLKEQGDPNRPFAYGFKIVIHDAGTTETSIEGPAPAPEEPSSEGTLEPIAEMYTTDDDVTVAIDLPGIEKESIHLSLIDGTLTIIAGGNQLTSVEMPTVDGDSMQSRYKNGVLEIKFSRGKPIRID